MIPTRPGAPSANPNVASVDGFDSYFHPREDGSDLGEVGTRELISDLPPPESVDAVLVMSEESRLGREESDEGEGEERRRHIGDASFIGARELLLLHLFAHVAVGDADDRHVGHLRML